MRRRRSVLAVVTASLAFTALALDAHRVAYFPVDLAITRAMQGMHDPWIAGALGALSWIGFPPVVGILYGTIAAAIFAVGRRREGLVAAFTAVGGAGINFVSKALVARPRPPASLVHTTQIIPNGSFPAGHVLNATAFLGFLCYLACVRMAPSWRRTALITLLVAMIACMGVARIYSGEHWPSDVLGGYLIGGIWLFTTIHLYRRLESRSIPVAERPHASRSRVILTGPHGRAPVQSGDGAKWRGQALLLAVIGLACARPAWAYRPFSISDADVAPTKTIEIEFGPAEFVEHGLDHAMHMPNLGVTFGMGGGYEVALEGINQVSLEPEEGEPRSRLIDSGVAVTKLLRRGTLQDAKGVSVATEGMVLFPTREAAHLGAELNGVVSNAGKVGVIHAQLEVTRLQEGTAGAGAAVAFESADQRGWRPIAEFALEGVRGEPSDKSVLLGTVFVAHEGLAFDFGLNLGQSEGVHWTEVRSGVTWQIGPRGTAPLRHFARFHLRRRHQDDSD